MGRELASLSDGGLTVSQRRTGDLFAVTLTGHLDIDSVEHLAACADQICRAGVPAAVFDLSGLVTADDAGARTLAAACQCLRTNGVRAAVRGVPVHIRQVLDGLGLTLPESVDGSVALLPGTLRGGALMA